MIAQLTSQTSPFGLEDLTQGLVIGTKVLTMEGELPVEYLSAGDRVITRNGARALVEITRSWAQNLDVVRISEGVLGHDRPEADLLVAPTQAILIRDWRARAFAGSASAMIPAARLVDGEYIRHEVLPEARLFTLHFEEPEVIYAGSLELSCPAALPALA
jgi:hypothetical protein